MAGPPARSGSGEMETLREALDRLERAGYRASFEPAKDGLLTVGGADAFRPEDLVVDEVVRFEGESDPADQAVLYALRLGAGELRGTFLARHGASVDPYAAEALHRLDDTATPGSRGR